MGQEIERKFLVNGDAWRARVRATHSIIQGYLVIADGLSVRVRIIDDWRAVITLKHEKAGPRVRGEYEYQIPLPDARELMTLSGDRLVQKERHEVGFGGKEWVVDEFDGHHRGLVMAELELDDPDEAFERPDWLGEEVTEDPRYANSSLASGGN